MGIPGGWELVLILAVLVLLFGASKLPSAARSIGQSMRIFKAETKGMRGDEAKQGGQSAQQTGGQATNPSEQAQSLPSAEAPNATPAAEQQPDQQQTPRTDSSR